MAVKTIIEQLRYNGNKEVNMEHGDANEVFLESLQAGSNFPLSVLFGAD